MNVGGGEAADQLVRMMLSGSEEIIKLSGSLLKNLLAITIAAAKHNKKISGKTKVADLVNMNFHLLGVLSRLGIKPGFGEKSHDSVFGKYFSRLIEDSLILTYASRSHIHSSECWHDTQKTQPLGGYLSFKYVSTCYKHRVSPIFIKTIKDSQSIGKAVLVVAYCHNRFTMGDSVPIKHIKLAIIYEVMHNMHIRIKEIISPI